MANVCINYVVFSGEDTALSSLKDFLLDIINAYEGVCSVKSEGFYNAYLNIQEAWNGVFTCESNWTCPINLLIAIAKEHHVSFTVEYEELGSLEYGYYSYDIADASLHHIFLSPDVISVIMDIEENEDGLYLYEDAFYESPNFILAQLLDELVKSTV
jgi:hypothetical protein